MATRPQKQQIRDGKVTDTLANTDGINKVLEEANLAAASGRISVGLRGIYSEELGKINLRESDDLTDEGGRLLGGTSVIGVTGDITSEDVESLTPLLLKAFSLAKSYGTVDRIAIVMGQQLTDEIINDIGENVFCDAKVIGYLDKKFNETTFMADPPSKKPPYEILKRPGNGWMTVVERNHHLKMFKEDTPVAKIVEWVKSVNPSLGALRGVLGLIEPQTQEKENEI